MIRTTIMVEEELLYDLKQVAQQQNTSMANVIREALASYLVEQQKLSPPANPLLGLAGLGASVDPMDVAEGRDEAILSAEIHPVTGWSVRDERSG